MFEYNTLGQTTAVTTTHNDDTVGNRVTQTYDDAGNLTHAADGTTYTYNTHNQPVSETRLDNTTLTHAYWATGQRATLTTETNSDNDAQADTVSLYWGGSSIINDTHTATDTPTATTGSYLIGASRHTRTLTAHAQTGVDIGDSTTNYYITDRHSNTTATINSAGAITATNTYDDYGVTTEHSASVEQTVRTVAERNPFLYAAEYTTPHGDQYLGKRTYAPKMFAFTTRDTANQFNLYSYTNSNPITLVDPSGQTPTADTIIQGIFIGAMILGAAATTVGLAIAGGPAGGLAAWAAFGIAVTGILADIGGAAIATAQIANQNKKERSGEGFYSDTTSAQLLWAEIGLGIGSLPGILGSKAAIAVAKPKPTASAIAEDVVNKSFKEYHQTARERIWRGEEAVHSITEGTASLMLREATFDELGRLPDSILDGLAESYLTLRFVPGQPNTYTHGGGRRNVIQIGKLDDLPPPRSPSAGALHEAGHTVADWWFGDVENIPEWVQREFNDILDKIIDRVGHHPYFHHGQHEYLRQPKELWADMFAWHYGQRYLVTPSGPFDDVELGNRLRGIFTQLEAEYASKW